MKWNMEISEEPEMLYVRIGWWFLSQNKASGEGAWAWLGPESVRDKAADAEREFLALTEAF